MREVPGSIPGQTLLFALFLFGRLFGRRRKRLTYVSSAFLLITQGLFAALCCAMASGRWCKLCTEQGPILAAHGPYTSNEPSSAPSIAISLSQLNIHRTARLLKFTTLLLKYYFPSQSLESYVATNPRLGHVSNRVKTFRHCDHHSTAVHPSQQHGCV